MRQLDLATGAVVLPLTGKKPVPTSLVGITADKCVGSRISVLGRSGSGKSNTVAVLTEEIAPHMTVALIDPEGEMHTLRERLDIVVVGASDNVDVEIDITQAAAVAKWSVEQGKHVILDLFGYKPSHGREVANAFAEALFEAERQYKRQHGQGRPYMVIVDEASIFMPEPSLEDSPWKILALRGRKFGIGMVIASQRSQNVDKTALTQCNIRILHEVDHPRDMNIYKGLVPLQSREVEDGVRSLTTGEAIVVYEHSGTRVCKAQMRMRHTRHDGATPSLDGTDPAQAAAPSVTDKDALKALRILIGKAKPPDVDPQIKALRTELKEVRDELTLTESLLSDAKASLLLYREEVKKLTMQAETLGRIQFAPIEIRIVGAADTAVIEAPSVIHQPREPYQPDVSKVARDGQARRLKKLVLTIGKLEARDAKILEYLMACQGQRYTLSQLEMHLGYADGSLRPPNSLVIEQLISKDDGHGLRTYTSDVPTLITNKFSALDYTETMNAIRSAARQRISS